MIKLYTLTFFSIFFLLQTTGNAQISFTNPNMEGAASAAGAAPPGWTVCASTPDIQPGQWCCTIPPQSGSNYIGICTGEYVGQILSAPMVANTLYTFDLWLAHTTSYYSAQVAGSCASARTGNGSLKIYASNSACGTTELIWQSPIIGGNGVWTKYTVAFTPLGNYTGICFMNDEPSSNLLIDNMNPVISLPIKLLSFKAEQIQENKTLLQWTSAVEENNKEYILEGSNDAVDFSEIDKIAGAGTSHTLNKYEYIDHSGYAYYKLLQRDFNGDLSFLNITHVISENSKESFLIKRISSDNNSSITIQINSKSSLPVHLLITDIYGREVYSRLFSGSELNSVLNLDIPQLSGGLYFMHAENGIEKTQVLKLGR